MKVLSWNYRGNYNATTVRALKAEIKGISPDVIFLCETKASASRMEEVLNSIKFADMCVVEAKGITGCICVMWKVGFMIHQVEYNKNLIAVKVFDALCSWLLVGFYGPPYPAKKQKGNTFTWARGRWGSSAIKRRLDRAIASISWRLAFPKAVVAHLGAINSDHAPILLDTKPEESFTHRPFRFEATWIRDNGCNSVVEKA
ncbi:hypothetical protein ACB092_10G099500 [Castanea dentata]